ncbi:hypothetical protein JRQ81_017648, partial [Phrynocephalus forsythii]
SVPARRSRCFSLPASLLLLLLLLLGAVEPPPPPPPRLVPGAVRAPSTAEPGGHGGPGADPPAAAPAAAAAAAGEGVEGRGEEEEEEVPPPPSVCPPPPGSPREPELPFDALYAAGVEAHSRGDFAGAVGCLERALSAERRLRETRLGCGLRCRREAPLAPGEEQEEAEAVAPLRPLRDLAFGAALLRRARCLRSCRRGAGLGEDSRHVASEEVRADFQRRVPYSYLQRAYTQLNQLDKAVDAAHTFFLANPEHMGIQQDLENYKTTAGKVDLVDREARPHMEDYLSGIRHYDREEYPLAIEFLERALTEYNVADTECRVLCEGPQRFEDYEYLDYKATLYEAIADHYLQILLCQHECVRELATRPGRLSPIDNYLPLHYDFLQFAYYRVGDYVQALECARSYLLFHPDDEDVLDNESYYESLLEGSVDLKTIKPRQGILMAGDGYRGKTSPHTPNEKFEGATVLKALKFGYEGRVPLRSARLFYDVSEKARKIVESYFLLNSTLYFSYTHLVCRTALSGQQERRNDLSHPIHADNCLLDPEANECWKEPPAYTFRDYSALLYMNSDFDGGEFIFTEMDAKTVTASIKPKCGRMISFSSGGENPHGVKAVTRGQRCAVALWFTLNPLYRELERIQADEVIAALDQERFGSPELDINPRDEL